MKKNYFLIFTIILLAFQSLYAQTVNSFITIKKNNETYVLSGIVSNEQVKNQVIEIIKNQTEGNINANGLKIDSNAIYLSSEWQKTFAKQISTIKNSKTAFVQFSDDFKQDDYPTVAEQLLNIEILLTENGEKIKLADYGENIIILSFVAEWSLPCQKTVLDLNRLYAEKLNNVRIIAVSYEDIKSDMWNFKQFVKFFKIKFQTGWTDQNFIDGFFEISKFNGVPQSFVIKNGKLHGFFVGYSPKVKETLVNIVRKISNE